VFLFRLRIRKVTDFYGMGIKDTQEGARLVWRQKLEQQQWLEAREGAYLLRTNLTVDGAAGLCKKYIQLTEVEGAFRTLKSELAIRPLFHQLAAWNDGGVEGGIFVKKNSSAGSAF
jgi:hypothetical protein